MRSEKKAEKDLIKENKRLMRRKKIAVFLLVFFLYVGLVIVDYAGSEMTGYPVHLPLQIRRVDSEYLSLSIGKLKLQFGSKVVTTGQK